jgi:LacI family transcriptional regulator
MIIQVDDTTPQTFKVAAQQIKQLKNDDVTAWICTNDELGYHQMQALTQMGIDVPGDVSLCAFDNQNPPAGCAKLTSINAPFADMGSVAVRVLREKIDSPFREPMRLMLSTWLVEGQSVKDICHDQ